MPRAAPLRILCYLLASAVILYLLIASGRVSLPRRDGYTETFTRPIDDGTAIVAGTGERPKILENGVLVMLVRNSELHEARFSMRGIEDRFNKRFGYDWVFLNDEPFTDEFKKLTSGLATGTAHYAVIPKEHWSVPKSINQTRMKEEMTKMADEDVIYGDSLSYRHMCRFNSGFFYDQPVMASYDYYFRVEPSVEYYCDFLEDPFKTLREKKAKYGWVMAMYEFDRTIPTLWETTQAFAKQHPEHIAPNNALGFLSDDASKTLQEASYNMCHFWSNFEIADLSFLRSKAYRDYFAHLDATGAFFYERWGDAPVHSIAAALFLNTNEIHHFEAVGYRHNPYIRCPPQPKFHTSGQCSCNPKDNFDTDGYSCFHQWERAVEQFKKKAM
ncbi:nucleotide-diphospho-sugar transferase [Protomyces lactucae-debilis]|uniref:Nucleotide-diphospho-sugar transferase n=1 Tax=Protomyces lactucae-debilis TaxID=2754530 RepID=A0A1Y2F6W6_PROLT|nr:nucleotide-diphospho-sugar transferase [Protomyces lactucae-debilis]ORY79076.1 nucleotide-diphospho-sugar transferase [Protomyces lactucae-debilis]